MYLGKLCLSIKVFFVFLFIKIMSGLSKGTVLSVSMLRFQYSMKFSFSSTLTGVYLYCNMDFYLQSIRLLLPVSDG